MKNITLFIIFVAILYFSTPILLEFYIKLDAEKLNEKTSLRGRYKVEKYIPLEYKSILFTVDSPFFIKVYDFKEEKYIFESDVYEMGQGTSISWPRTGLPNIIVGTGIVTHDLELEE